MTMKDYPSRGEKKTQTDSSPQGDKPAPAKMRKLDGEYRVREGYTIPYGPPDTRQYARGGDKITLSHDEAVSLIRTSMHQKDSNGKPNGPCIESFEAYEARMEAQRKQDEFTAAIAANNPLFDENPHV